MPYTRCSLPHLANFFHSRWASSLFFGIAVRVLSAPCLAVFPRGGTGAHDGVADLGDVVNPVEVDPLLTTIFIHDLDLIVLKVGVGYYAPSVAIEHYFTAVADVFLNCHTSIIPPPHANRKP